MLTSEYLSSIKTSIYGCRPRKVNVCPKRSRVSGRRPRRGSVIPARTPRPPNHVCGSRSPERGRNLLGLLESRTGTEDVSTELEP